MEVVTKIELSRYDTRSINIQLKSNGFIPNGFDNLFPNYLDGLYNNSPTHQCIVDDLTGYVIGKGIVSDNLEDEYKIKRFFNKKVLKQIDKYKRIHSSICLLVIRNALFEIQKIKVLNPSQIRVSQTNQLGNPVMFKFKKTWDTNVSTYSWTNGVEIPFYDKFSKESLYYWYDSGTFDLPYGRPSYLSATDPIEFEISLYTGDNHGAQNGMTPSVLIEQVTSGDPEQDDKDQKAIVSNLSGVTNRGKVAFVKKKAGETTPTNITLLTDNEKESKKINYEVAESGILKGWRIPSPTLISGLNIKPTGFGDAEAEMQWALNTLKSKIIEPEQEELLETLEPIFNELGILGNLDFEPLKDKNIAVQEEVQDVQVNENLKNLTGRQLQNIQRFVRKFKKGDITRKQAELNLKSGFGLTDAEVEAWLEDEETQLSKVFTLEMLIDGGETYESLLNDGWEIESIEDAKGTVNEEEEFSKVHLASTGTARPNSKTSQSGKKGNVKYKILYRYTGNPNPQREFCKKMMAANKLYRFEDLKRLDNVAVNAGFGIKGASTYPIFDYKGGVNCKHKFERVTLVMNGDGNIDHTNPNSPDINQLTESQADNRNMTPTGEAKERQKKSETTPYNMPNRGRYTLSSIIDYLKKQLWQN